MRRRALLPLLAAASISVPAAGQTDSTRGGPEIAGAVSVTTKGISTIPSFTLGKPAAIFDLSMAGRALSFEPQLRFGLDGRPWSFLFWWRYRLVEGRRLHVGVGAHPAVLFRTTTVSSGGTQREVIEARRYLAGEIQPSYELSPHVGVGTYYLYSYGLERNVAKHTHFLSLRANLATGELPARVVVRVAPQAYYLRTDARHGTYVNAALTVSRRNLPLSISAMMNRTVRSDIEGERWLWNVSLSYAFQLGR